MDRKSDIALPSEAGDRLGPFYVYTLIDPRNDKIFYVGKGTGSRLLSHGKEADLASDSRSQSAKISRIREIRASGTEPRIDVIRHGLSEQQALLVEATLIDCIEELVNIVAGHGKDKGRSSLDELISLYGAQPINNDAPPALLIRLGPWKEKNIDKEIEPGIYRTGIGYKEGITPSELMNSTRAWWRIDPKRIQKQKILHAVAVYEGVTRGLMQIGDWTEREDKRRAFTATFINSGPVFEEWVGPFGKRVDFTRGAQTPIAYWPRRR